MQKFKPEALAGIAANEDAGAHNHAHESQDGAQGFDDKLGGQGMADRNNTSSFDARPELQTPVTTATNANLGQEEHGDTRQPTSGIVARNSSSFTASQPEPGVDQLMQRLGKPKQ